MAFRFTIGKKIGFGFGALLFFVIIVFYTTYVTLNASIAINNKITEVNNPSLASLEELKLLIVRSKMYVFNWVKNPKTDHPDKAKHRRLINYKYPQLEKKIAKLAIDWNKKDQAKIKHVFQDVSKLFVMHKEVMALLHDFDSYSDPLNQFQANMYTDDDGEIFIKTKEILYQLNSLIDNQKYQTGTVTTKMQNSFSFLKLLAKYLGLALLLGGFFIAVYTTRSIVKPVNNLKDVLLTVSKGIFPSHNIKARHDEIGEMTEALNKVVAGLKRTEEFAYAVGAGQFNTHYEPLSKEDSLGKALVKMRDDLAENERVLEQKVIARTAEVVKQKEEIEGQNTRISELYEEVTDSIKYAKGLQEAILPPNEFIEKVLPNSFVLFKPKDIVSGDFYWIEEKNDIVYFAAVDCTGHGVPGAFMSIVGYNALNEALRKNNTPSEILDALNKGISKTLHNNSMNAKHRDGMDLALCSYNKNTRTLKYAGAFNPLYLLRKGEITQIKADKFPIGSYFDDKTKKYTNHEIQLEQGDYIYVFSDGYADQFGGPRGKKFMYKRFKENLLALEGKEIQSQKEYLNNTIDDWKGPLEQIDDILVIGVHIV